MLAAAIQQGIPLTRDDQVADAEVNIPMSQYRVCGGQHFASTDTWSPHTLHRSAGNMNALHRHPGLGEHRSSPSSSSRPGCASPTSWPRRWASRSTDPATEMVPSFTLGVASVSPLELADAYATFAARGLHCDPRPVISIDDSNGNHAQDLPARSASR